MEGGQQWGLMVGALGSGLVAGRPSCLLTFFLSLVYDSHPETSRCLQEKDLFDFFPKYIFLPPRVPVSSFNQCEMKLTDRGLLIQKDQDSVPASLLHDDGQVT